MPAATGAARSGSAVGSTGSRCRVSGRWLSCAEMLPFAQSYSHQRRARSAWVLRFESECQYCMNKSVRRCNSLCFYRGTVMAMSEAKKKDLKGRRAAPLVTPSDLGPKASQEIAGGMNAILAD